MCFKSNMPNYIVVKNAVPQALCTSVAQEFSTAPETASQDAYQEVQPTPSSKEIAQHVHKVIVFGRQRVLR